MRKLTLSEINALENEICLKLQAQRMDLLKIKNIIEKHNIRNWLGEDTTNLKEICNKVVFGKKDVVEKILKKYGYNSIDDCEMGGMFRDMQHEIIADICG